MADKNRIFISFAAEDARFRDLLVGQARNENSPFTFADMSVKEPWSDSWKTRCRTKIRGCDGTIALVSKATRTASGQLWEVKCSRDEDVPVRGIYVTSNDRPTSLPEEFQGVRVVAWTWQNISSFLNGL